MKLASLKSGGRDGTLVVVSRDLRRAVPVPDIAPTLQAALDDWATVAGELGAVSRRLDGDAVSEARPFDPHQAHSPLPRAYQLLDGSAYVHHMERVHRSRGLTMPERYWTEPCMYQAGSDTFVGPRDPMLAADGAWGLDFEAEIAIVTDDVPMGIGAPGAARHVALIMLLNDFSLRNLIVAEKAKGLGFIQCKPTSAFSPVAVTPDELGDAWDGGRVNLPLRTTLNGSPFGAAHGGAGMTFDFPALIAHGAKTRALGAGAIIGSGPVSGSDPEQVCAAIAEKRIHEADVHGEARTPFLRFGDTVRIEMLDDTGTSLFGAIEQTAEKYEGPSDHAMVRRPRLDSAPS